MEEYPKISLDYARDLQIDQGQLEVEWLTIAGQIMRYSEAHVQAQFDRDRAKQRRDVVEAELDNEARTDPHPTDLPISEKTKQPTETAIMNWVHKQARYQAAQKERQEKEYVVNMLQAAVFAFQAKKMALENLVHLFKMKYFAEPYDGKDGENRKAKAMQDGRLEASMAAREKRAPVAPATDKDSHRYAIGPISEDGRHVFNNGPFPELSQALGEFGGPDLAIYKLTRGKPDVMIYTWSGDQWTEVGKAEVQTPAPTQRRLPPRPPARPAQKG